MNLPMLKPSARDRIKSAFQFLNRFTNYERSLRYPYDGWAMNLERVRALLGPIGSPEKNLKAIHIAGTKGKGSTSKLIQSILSSAGFRADPSPAAATSRIARSGGRKRCHMVHLL